MKITKLALLSFLAAGFLAAVPTTDAASVYGGYPAADDADDEDDGLATLNQTPNDEIELGDDDISVLRKGGGSGGGGVVGAGGGGSSIKRCKSGKTRETLPCGGYVTGKVRLTEGLKCPGLGITVKEGATLDCGGNTIFGSSGDTGIVVEEGGTVRNCKLTSFRDGISSTGPSTITNCVISDVKNALFYNPSTSSPKDKYEAKNVYITGAEFGIFVGPDEKTNKFKFDSVTIANPDTSGDYYGIYVDGDVGGSSLTFNTITLAADAVFDQVEGSGTIKIKSSIFDGGGVYYTESGTTNDIKLSIEKTLIINAPGDGISYRPRQSSSSTLDVSDSSLVLSGGDGVAVAFGTATLDSVELSGNGGDGLDTFDGDSDVTAKNILVQFNGGSGIFTGADASVNVNDSKVCQNDSVVDIGGRGAGLALNNVVCETVSLLVSAVTCPSSPDTCTADEKVATTSCD